MIKYALTYRIIAKNLNKYIQIKRQNQKYISRIFYQIINPYEK